MQQAPAPRGAPLSDRKDRTSEDVLLVTKLARPSVGADLVARPRLVSQLQLGIQRPLTLIAAPAGFGKTTLLSSWLEHAPLRSAWLSLERDDDDLTRFWSYVFTALERAYPGSGASALALLQGSTPKPLPPIETVLTVWINGLAALTHEVALILDDYHLITARLISASPLSSGMISRLLRELSYRSTVLLQGNGTRSRYSHIGCQRVDNHGKHRAEWKERKPLLFSRFQRNIGEPCPRFSRTGGAVRTDGALSFSKRTDPGCRTRRLSC